jgi:hypothetical protein
LQTQSAEEPFPTTSDDLAGFWDMVQLQVAHVDSLFQELKEMKAHGWQEVSSIIIDEFEVILIKILKHCNQK